MIFWPSIFTIQFLAHYSLFIKKGHYSLIIIPHPDPHLAIIGLEIQCSVFLRVAVLLKINYSYRLELWFELTNFNCYIILQKLVNN